MTRGGIPSHTAFCLSSILPAASIYFPTQTIMATCTVINPDQPFHVRSNSMPSRPHPIALKLQEQLHSLRSSCVDQPKGTTLTQLVCDGFRGLGDLYHSIQELLQLPHNSQTLSHSNHREFAEALLEGSISLLDACDASKDNLLAAKEQIQDLQFSLRKNNHQAFQSKADAYTRFRRKAGKYILRSSKLVNKGNRCASHPDTGDNNNDMLLIDSALVEAKQIMLSLLRSVSFLLSIPMQTSSRWSLVSKALQRRKVACGDWNYDQLQTLEAGVEGIESELEFFFKRLIQHSLSPQHHQPLGILHNCTEPYKTHHRHPCF